MQSNELELIKILKGCDYVTPDQLAKHFGVSERTVRTYVKRANDALKDVASITNTSNRGYKLVVHDPVAFERGGGYGSGRSAQLPQTTSDRVTYLIDDLLSRTDWVTIDQLGRILYVSPRTISTALKEVEQTLERFDLKLERKPHYGIKVVGPEVKRRICMANVLMSKAVDRTADTTDLMLDKVASCVDKTLSEEHFEINSAAYQNLLVHIGVAILRIREGYAASLDQEMFERIQVGREYEVASSVVAHINEAFNMTLPEEETAYIAIHLMGKQILDIAADGEDSAAISDDVWDVVSRMLDLVRRSFHIDLRDDLELRMNLARHIVPLSVRLRYQMKLANPLLSEIKQRFPLAYSMALDAAAVLANAYNSTMSDDEIGYIALAFALSLERQKEEPVKKNILVICASGAGSARMLEYQYRKEFGKHLNRVVACDFAQLDKIDFSGFDYAFTTVPLRRRLPIPVRQVGFFLDRDEADRVRTVLESHTPTEEMGNFFSRDLFFSHVDFGTKKEVLDFLCAAAGDVFEISRDFRSLVDQRETLASTAFGGLVAMPHPLEPASEKTFVATCLLDRPVSWGDHDVRAVFLVSIAQDANPPQEFYERFSRLMGNESSILALLEDQSYGRLLEALSETKE